MSSLSASIVDVPRSDAGAEGQTPGPRDDGWYPQARALVADLYVRSPVRYWTDLLLSAGSAWALTAVYFMAPAWSALQILAFLGASILFFRAGTFIHELVHLPPGQLPGFGRVWNLLMGIPLLMPWVMYRNHVDHHSARFFGTPDDGEYLPLAASPKTELLKYLAQAPLLPLATLLRFGLLGPLSWLHRGLREWVLTHASAAVTNTHYRKRFPAREEKHLATMELLCFAWIATLAALVAGGVISLQQVLMGYLLLAWTLALNWVRNLAAHRYGNGGDRMTHLEQFAESINITGQTWLTVLLFPVGLRYHATHHLFPSMPYHNLGEAHARLSRGLPPDAPYHASGRASFFAAAAELWRAAGRTPREQSAMLRWLRRPQLN
jgi:fatty acid desaturase